MGAGMEAGVHGRSGTAQRSRSVDPPARHARSAHAAPAQLAVRQLAVAFTPLSLPPEADLTQIWRADPATRVTSLSPKRGAKRMGAVRAAAAASCQGSGGGGALAPPASALHEGETAGAIAGMDAGIGMGILGMGVGELPARPTEGCGVLLHSVAEGEGERYRRTPATLTCKC